MQRYIFLHIKLASSLKSSSDCFEHMLPLNYVTKFPTIINYMDETKETSAIVRISCKYPGLKPSPDCFGTYFEIRLRDTFQLPLDRD